MPEKSGCSFQPHTHTHKHTHRVISWNDLFLKSFIVCKWPCFQYMQCVTWKIYTKRCSLHLLHAPKGSFMFYVRYGHGRSLLSLLCIHFVSISVCLREAYGYAQNVAVPPEIGGVGWCSLQFKQDQWNTMKKNILEKLQKFLRQDCTRWYRNRDICCCLALHRDRQLQQNSWERRNWMGNKCQLDGSEGEVEVHATPVCSLRGALYWMYCITSIPS